MGFSPRRSAGGDEGLRWWASGGALIEHEISGIRFRGRLDGMKGRLDRHAIGH